MSEKNTLACLTDILVEQLGVRPDECVPDARIVDDLGADSLDCVEIVMAVEEEFNVDMPDEEADKMLTVRDWVSKIDELQNA